MIEPLSSLQNPRIKQLVALRDTRQRRRTGLTRIDGGRELLRAISAGVLPETVFFREDLQAGEDLARALSLCEQHGLALQPVTEAVYGKIRYGDRDEGVCATVRWEPRRLADLPATDSAFWLVVEGVEKPGNLGALLRTADAAGVDGVILADPACDPANPNVIRASIGTLFTQPVARASTDEAIAFLQRHGTSIVISRPQASTAWHAVDLRPPVAVVSGAEDRGLTDAWRRAATLDVALPMAGFADSLNLAAATAILLYEVVRQRG
jgi:TrmH family RNA methyltransferase